MTSDLVPGILREFWVTGQMNDWMAGALCASGQYNPDDWFVPYPVRDGRTRQAQIVAQRAVRVCRQCPVRQECLEWALRTREKWAIAGGLTPSQRTYLLRNPSPKTLAYTDA